MDIRVCHEPPHTTAHVSGELTQLATDELAAKLRPLVDGDARCLAVDVSGLKYIDSSGLGCLVDLAARANMHGCRMILVSPSPFVRGVLDQTRLSSWFEACDSLTEAARRFSETAT